MKPKFEMPATEDYANALNLLAVHTEAANRLAELETDANDQFIDIVDGLRADYAEAQIKLSESEAALRLIAEAHPEWFADSRSFRTPYGAIKWRKAPKLDVANEEATLAKLELREERVDGFKAEDFTRTRKELNLEALERLDDATLKQLGIARIIEDKFSVTPAKVDLGKAVKQAAAKAAQPAEAA